MVHPSWSDEEVNQLQEAEQNMDNVLANPNSTYTEMVESIDNFFSTW